jgi:sec-independent protein translocase protein TatA
MGLSIWHILVVVIVVTLLFGAGRVPRVMEDVAKGIKAFKKGMKDEEDTPAPKAPKAIESSRSEEPARESDTVNH